MVLTLRISPSDRSYALIESSEASTSLPRLVVSTSCRTRSFSSCRRNRPCLLIDGIYPPNIDNSIFQGALHCIGIGFRQQSQSQCAAYQFEASGPSRGLSEQRVEFRVEFR